MDAIVFDTEFKDLTANKTARGPSKKYIGVLWHETAGNPDNPKSTLRYNLPRSVGSSYHFLIARNGIIYCYLEPTEYTAWHAGESRCTIDGDGYVNWAVNEALIGVELDGKNDGTPVSAYQLASAARLALFFRDAFGIPLDREHQLTHAQVALPKGRKTDPRCTTPEAIIERAFGILAAEAPPPDYATLWGTAAPYRADWGVPGLWRPLAVDLGAAMTDEQYAPGITYQWFEHGIVIWEPAPWRGAYLRGKKV